jgi:hypothetical protein
MRRMTQRSPLRPCDISQLTTCAQRRHLAASQALQPRRFSTGSGAVPGDAGDLRATIVSRDGRNLVELRSGSCAERRDDAGARRHVAAQRTRLAHLRGPHRHSAGRDGDQYGRHEPSHVLLHRKLTPGSGQLSDDPADDDLERLHLRWRDVV